MSRLKALGLALGALALTQLPAIAQTTKVTNDGISANEIVIGTHQDCRVRSRSGACRFPTA